MKVKYNIDKKVWSPSFSNGEYRVESCTIERIDIKGKEPNYKMEEGCSYWRTEIKIFVDKEDVISKCEILNKEIIIKRALREEIYKFWESMGKDRFLRDGIYDVTNISFYQTTEDERMDHLDEIKLFIKDNPEYVIAHAYETYIIFILGRRPEKIINQSTGSGFNYGSTNIIDNCPRTILILAEND